MGVFIRALGWLFGSAHSGRYLAYLTFVSLCSSVAFVIAAPRRRRIMDPDVDWFDGARAAGPALLLSFALVILVEIAARAINRRRPRD
jgi:hypothetical protein